MKIILRCISGQLAGQEWNFDGQGTITVGRGSDSMVRMPQDENTVSRRQCIIEVMPPNVYVSDAGSAHGTWVNRQMIGRGSQGGRYQIQDGSMIGIGANGQAIVLQIMIAESGAGRIHEGRVCAYCGRPLAPGEVCQCRNGRRHERAGGYDIPQQPADGAGFGQTMQDTFRSIGGVYKDPVGQAGKFARLNDCVPGIILICVNLIIFFLLCMIVMSQFSSYVSYNYGYYAGGSTLSASFYLVLFAALNYFALAGLLLLTSNTFFQARTTFAGMAGLVGIKAVWDATFLLTGSLIAAASPQIAVIIWSVGALLTWMILLFGYADIVPLSGNRKLYSAFIAVVILILIDILICRSFLMNIIYSFSNIF